MDQVELANAFEGPVAIKEAERTVKLIEEHFAGHHSPYTKRAYAYELRSFFRAIGKVDLSLITRRDLLAYKEYISSRYKPSTVTWKLAAVGGFLRYAHRQGAIPEDIADGVKGPRVRQNRPEFLRLMGKGRKPRVHRILPEVKEAIDCYLVNRKEAKPEDYLFITIPLKGDELRPLSPGAVQKAIKRYAAYPLIKRDITPHTLIYTAAMLELEGAPRWRRLGNSWGI